VLLNSNRLQFGLIARSVFSIEFAYREEMVRIKAASLSLPQYECSARATAAIGEGMNCFDPMI